MTGQAAVTATVFHATSAEFWLTASRDTLRPAADAVRTDG
jgi:hypothetical protein